MVAALTEQMRPSATETELGRRDPGPDTAPAGAWLGAGNCDDEDTRLAAAAIWGGQHCKQAS